MRRWLIFGAPEAQRSLAKVEVVVVADCAQNGTSCLAASGTGMGRLVWSLESERQTPKKGDPCGSHWSTIKTRVDEG